MMYRLVFQMFTPHTRISMGRYLDVVWYELSARARYMSILGGEGESMLIYRLYRPRTNLNQRG